MVQMMTIYWRWYNDIYADVESAWIGVETTAIPNIPAGAQVQAARRSPEDGHRDDDGFDGSKHPR